MAAFAADGVPSEPALSGRWPVTSQVLAGQLVRLPSPRPKREMARWALSFGAILALHVLAAVLVFQHWMNAPIPASDAPSAVLIDLAPPPAAPEAPSSLTPPSVAEPEAAAPEPVPEIVPDPLPEPAPLDAPPMPVPDATALPETALAPEPEPEPPPLPLKVEPAPAAPAAAVALPPSPPNIQPVAKPRPKPKTVERKPRPAQATTRAELREARRPPAEASGARTTASLPSMSNGASSAASKAAWQSQLVAYLQRNLRYPSGTGGGGSAAVSFSIDRYGRVLSARLARSAGSSELDAAALALFRGTLPAAPADVSGSTFAFTIPVRFNR